VNKEKRYYVVYRKKNSDVGGQGGVARWKGLSSIDQFPNIADIRTRVLLDVTVHTSHPQLDACVTNPQHKSTNNRKCTTS